MRDSRASTWPTFAKETVTGTVPVNPAAGGAITSSFTLGAAHSITVSRRLTTTPGPTPLSEGFTTSTATRVFPTRGVA